MIEKARLERLETGQVRTSFEEISAFGVRFVCLSYLPVQHRSKHRQIITEAGDVVVVRRSIKDVGWRVKGGME